MYTHTHTHINTHTYTHIQTHTHTESGPNFGLGLEADIIRTVGDEVL